MSRFEVIRPRKPSLLERVGHAIRSYTVGQLSLKDPELAKYFSGGQTSTGVSVSEYTALNYSAVWSAVNLIAGDVASLPLVLYRRKENGKERYDSHPLYRVLHDSPNPEMSSITFRQTLQAHVLTWGNGYAEIERDMSGRAKYLWPITPERVQPIRENGALAYRVTNENGRDTYLSPGDMIHVPGLGWDGVQGYSPIAKARESVALGLAAEKFGGTFYGNGSTFGGVITHPTRFANPMARENFEKSLRNRHKGIERAHGLLLLEEGMAYAQVGIPPDQAQFLESRQFQITEVARWFNVPPHKIGDLSRATFSNIEQQNIEYFQTTLIHWLEAWEQELMRKLISPLERNQQFIEHVVEGLLRGDSQGRAALETAEFQIGGLTPNESRSLSNRNPIDGGDRAFVPMNMIPLDRVDDWIDAQIDKAKPAPPSPVGDGADRAALHLAVEELRVALASEREAHATTKHLIGALEQRATDLSGALEQLEEQADVAEATASQTIEQMDGLRSALAAEQAERAREKAEAEQRIEALGREVLTAQQERDNHESSAQGLLQTVAAERARAEQLQGDCETLRSDLDAAQSAYKNEVSRHDFTIEKSAGAEAERDAATARAEVAETQARAAEATRASAVIRADQADHDKAIAEQAQQAASETIATLQTELKETRENHAARVAGVLVAHRGLIVDVMHRMVEREIDRAKRHQTTPQKFRAWVDSFYTTHSEAVAEALLPAVRAHLSVLASPCDPYEMARQLAEDHVAESSKQLRDLLHVEDFAPMLERTLEQWATSRPEAVADRLLTKGLADVR